MKNYYIRSRWARWILGAGVVSLPIALFITMISIGESSFKEARNVLCLISMGWAAHIVLSFINGWRIYIGALFMPEQDVPIARIFALLVGALVYLLCGWALVGDLFQHLE